MNYIPTTAQAGQRQRRLHRHAPLREPSFNPMTMTLLDAFQRGMRIRDKWITSKDKPGLRQIFDKVAEYFGLSTELSAISREDVLEWRYEMLDEDGRREGTTLSTSTVNHRLSMMSVLLDIAELPAHKVKHLSTRGNHRMRRISDEELARLPQWLASRDHLKGAYTFRDLIGLALQTGARQGELIGLTWEDVSPATLTFRDTKNSESRTVPLTAAAKAVMAGRTGFAGGPFTDVDKFRMTVLWADFREFMELQKDHEFVFHALRHEALSRLADRGVNAFTIQAIAGHSNVTTTQRYVKSSLRAMAEAMGAD